MAPRIIRARRVVVYRSSGIILTPRHDAFAALFVGVMHVLLILIAGFCAGFLNVTAGGGSLFSIPVLLLIGLPPHIAIGTNRAAVTVHALTGFLAYQRAGKLSLTPLLPIAPPAMLGSILGAQIVISIEEHLLKQIIAVALLLLFLFFLVSPRMGIGEATAQTSQKGACSPKLRLYDRRWVTTLVAFSLGVYGGFLGVGVSTFFIALLVVSSGFTFLEATATTQFVVFLLSLSATGVFAIQNAIDYQVALPLALSMAAGASIGAIVAVRYGDRWVRAIFLAVILVLILALLRIQVALGWVWRWLSVSG